MPNQQGRHRPLEILLVEDSPSEALLTKEALRQGEVRTTLHHVEDGVEALAFLRKQDGYVDAPRPDLVFLDWNLPRKGGREVLQEIRRDKSLCVLPVIVLTTSKDENDVLAAYRLSANCYVAKPVDLNQFAAALRALGDFWGTWAMLPPQPTQ
jgi:CheY-like chemotaxis protein